MSVFDLHTARPLGHEFFERPTAEVARDLLGKVLVSRIGGVVAGGRIVEAEAYLGRDDPGSHAATKGITKRNAVMYGPPGCAYVYFTYGNHHMLNLVTEPDGVAGAVLVRAIEPVFGIEAMRLRRDGKEGPELTNGPGKVASALGVTLEHNGARLSPAGPLCCYDAPPPPEPVRTSGRIGLSEGHDAELRFFLEGNPFVSKARPGRRRPGRATRREAKA
ncbi:MAG: DNA-3-methyladenine glycosylase [Anaerosomatales bacterium]|nr:DNA-3-methyladenine glycosylase [Anaerosomatales bacterium]